MCDFAICTNLQLGVGLHLNPYLTPFLKLTLNTTGQIQDLRRGFAPLGCGDGVPGRAGDLLQIILQRFRLKDS